jgi:hypothetical protein
VGQGHTHTPGEQRGSEGWVASELPDRDGAAGGVATAAASLSFCVLHSAERKKGGGGYQKR